MLIESESCYDEVIEMGRDPLIYTSDPVEESEGRK